MCKSITMMKMFSYDYLDIHAAKESKVRTYALTYQMIHKNVVV